MKINFIVPSWHYFDNPFKLQPYWEMYYATILRNKLKDKAEIKITDLRGESKKNNFEKTINEIEQKLNR